MDSFYVKLKDDYCILYEGQISCEILPFISYLIHQKMIDDEACLKAYQIIQQNALQENHQHFFPVMNYRLSNVKNSSNQNRHYTFEKIKEEYEKIQHLAGLYDTLIKEGKKHQKTLKQLTMLEFKDYCNYPSLMNSFQYSETQKVYKSYSHGTKNEYHHVMDLLYKQFSTLFSEQKVVQIINVNNFFKNKFSHHITRLENILDKNGVPFVIEEDKAEKKFKEKVGFALFCQDNLNAELFGFFSANNSALVDINQAKLFQNQAHAERYIKQSGLSNVVITKVNVRLEEIIRKVGDIDTMELEKAKIAQEKELLERMMSKEENINEVIQLLVNTYGTEHHLLKEELIKLLKIREKPLAKTKRKI